MAIHAYATVSATLASLKGKAQIPSLPWIIQRKRSTRILQFSDVVTVVYLGPAPLLPVLAPQ